MYSICGQFDVPCRAILLCNVHKSYNFGLKVGIHISHSQCNHVVIRICIGRLIDADNTSFFFDSHSEEL